MAIDHILEKTLQGERLNLEDGIALYESEEVEKIGWAANKITERLHPEGITTFVIGRNINYSNVCDTFCRFCAFSRPAGHIEAYLLTNEQIFKKIEELLAVGGTEILMQGGTHPNLPFSYYLELLQEIKKRYPTIHIHSYSVAEVLKMAEVANLPYSEVLKKLHNAGLDSLPGAGAEILDDRIRLKISKRKGSWTKWIDVMKTAHRIGMSTTATMVIGFGETYEERVLHFLRIREAQDETKGFLAFIPWTFQPDNTRLKREKTSADEYLKTVAISRLMLDNIPNIQSSWVTMGAEVGKQSLFYGCNDFGSTMMEENVVSAAGTTHQVNNSLIVRLIKEAGRIPAQRNTKYQILRIFNDHNEITADFSEIYHEKTFS